MKRQAGGAFYFRLVLLALFLAAIAWSATKINWAEIGRQLASASPPAVAGMALFWLLTLCIRPLRLLVLLRTLEAGTERRYQAVWCADVIAMAANSILPMRAGDMMMAFVLKQKGSDRTAGIFSVVMVDRFFDFATVVVIFMSTLALAPTIAPWAANVTLALGVALAFLVGMLWLTVRFRRLWLKVCELLLSRMSSHRSGRWRARLHDLFDGLASVDRISTLAMVVALSVGVWATTSASYWFGLSAVRVEAQLVAAAFAASAVALSFVVPITPGGVGVFHAAAVLALSIFGVPAETALAFAIILHAFQLGSVLILATIALLIQGIGVRTLVKLRRDKSIENSTIALDASE